MADKEPSSTPSESPKRIRPRRCQEKPSNLQYVDLDAKWSVEDIQNLLDGLKRHGREDIHKLYKCVPRKQPTQVKHYLRRMDYKLKRKKREPNVKAPIEIWHELTHNLVRYEHDYSTVLARVMSIAGNLEPHIMPEPSVAPNYSKLYSFLVAIMKCETPPQLAPLDAAVMLDLLQVLVTTLQKSNFEDQQNLMLQKYRLLHQRVFHNNTTIIEAYKASRIALEEDLLMENKQNGSSSTGTADSEISQPSTSTAGQQPPNSDEPQQQSKTNGDKSQDEMQVADHEELEKSKKSPTQDGAAASHKALPTKGKRKQGTCCLRLAVKPKKTSNLYTLNPFCIPVKYLKLHPKKT